jgi:hypothetical protein
MERVVLYSCCQKDKIKIKLDQRSSLTCICILRARQQFLQNRMSVPMRWAEQTECIGRKGMKQSREQKWLGHLYVISLVKVKAKGTSLLCWLKLAFFRISLTFLSPDTLEGQINSWIYTRWHRISAWVPPFWFCLLDLV